jgi:hypothetical protein
VIFYSLVILGAIFTGVSAARGIEASTRRLALKKELIQVSNDIYDFASERGKGEQALVEGCFRPTIDPNKDLKRFNAERQRQRDHCNTAEEAYRTATLTLYHQRFDGKVRNIMIETEDEGLNNKQLETILADLPHTGLRNAASTLAELADKLH